MKGIVSSRSHFRLVLAAIGIAKDTGNSEFWGDVSEAANAEVGRSATGDLSYFLTCGNWATLLLTGL